MDVGSCPGEVRDRAMASRELARVIGRLNPQSLVLKVAGKEEYLLEEKSLSQYKVSVAMVTAHGAFGDHTATIILAKSCSPPNRKCPDKALLIMIEPRPYLFAACHLQDYIRPLAIHTCQLTGVGKASSHYQT